MVVLQGLVQMAGRMGGLGLQCTILSLLKVHPATFSCTKRSREINTSTRQPCLQADRFRLASNTAVTRLDHAWHRRSSEQARSRGALHTRHMALRQAPRLMALAAQHGAAAAAAAAAAGAAAAPASSSGLQQACGRQHRLFQQLVTSMRADAVRLYSQQPQPAFQPSRLYPRQHATSEACAFWGLVGLNAGFAFVAKSDSPDVRQAIARHFTTSVEALAGGRYYTLLTSSICHTSLVHAALNLLLLLLYRHTQPLAARELLLLYVLGSVVGSLTHIAYCWWDAAGQQYGLRYAANTPGLLGCSGAVAAITAFKTTLEPMGLPHVGLPLPIPLVVAALLFCCLHVRESNYSDYSGKWGAAAVGVAAALVAAASGRRRLAWRQH